MGEEAGASDITTNRANGGQTDIVGQQRKRCVFDSCQRVNPALLAEFLWQSLQW
jgi:hypothetical protein